jgi:hypothetical protein
MGCSYRVQAVLQQKREPPANAWAVGGQITNTPEGVGTSCSSRAHNKTCNRRSRGPRAAPKKDKVPDNNTPGLHPKGRSARGGGVAAATHGGNSPPDQSFHAKAALKTKGPARLRGQVVPGHRVDPKQRRCNPLEPWRRRSAASRRA